MHLQILKITPAVLLAAALIVAFPVSSEEVDADEFAQRIAFCEQRSEYVAEIIKMKRRNVSALDALKEIQTFDPSHYEYLIKVAGRVWNEAWGTVQGQSEDEQMMRYIDQIVLGCVRGVIPEPASRQ